MIGKNRPGLVYVPSCDRPDADVREEEKIDDDEEAAEAATLISP